MKYQLDAGAVLQELRQREFEAGRYNPAEPFPEFPVRPDSPTPGPQHDSIDEALEDAAEDGTRSILDIGSIGDAPDYGIAAPFPKDELLQYFGTPQPTKEMVSKNFKFMSSIERGQCVYFTVFKDGRPSELCFAGYSYD